MSHPPRANHAAPVKTPPWTYSPTYTPPARARESPHPREWHPSLFVKMREIGTVVSTAPVGGERKRLRTRNTRGLSARMRRYGYHYNGWETGNRLQLAVRTEAAAYNNCVCAAAACWSCKNLWKKLGRGGRQHCRSRHHQPP